VPGRLIQWKIWVDGDSTPANKSVAAFAHFVRYREHGAGRRAGNA